MFGSIIQIIIGLLVWKLVPGWIEYGDRKVRDFIQLCCNIIGISLVIFGAIGLIRQLLCMSGF